MGRAKAFDVLKCSAALWGGNRGGRRAGNEREMGNFKDEARKRVNSRGFKVQEGVSYMAAFLSVYVTVPERMQLIKILNA